MSLKYIKLFEELNPHEQKSRYGKVGRSELLAPQGTLFTGQELKVNEILAEYAPWYDLENIKTPIYRGRTDEIYTKKDNPSYLLINPSKHTRQSAYATGNYYSEIMDNSDRWEEYPKRKNSIICATDLNKVRSYGRAYRVIPLNKDVKFGRSVKDDIFFSFPFLFKKLREYVTMDGYHLGAFSGWMDDIMSDLSKDKDYFTYEEMKEYFQIKGREMNDYFKKDLELFEQGYSFLDVLEEWMDPEKNEFSLFNYNNLGLYNTGNEVWTDANCLLIRQDVIDDYLNEKDLN